MILNDTLYTTVAHEMDMWIHMTNLILLTRAWTNGSYSSNISEIIEYYVTSSAVLTWNYTTGDKQLPETEQLY